MKYIEAEFYLDESFVQKLRRQKPKFGYQGFGELTYYRSYSRMILDPVTDQVVGQEHWVDTVVRVIEGIMSIRMDHYLKNRIHWDVVYWQQFAQEMADYLFAMKWMPPGRGLWSMGTQLIRDRGAMALYNCCYSEIGENWIFDLCWIMDTLMYGCGVGFGPIRTGLKLYEPDGQYSWQIPDSREGWVESLKRLLEAYATGSALPLFDYSIIRPEGALISTFGGIASGPDPLKDLHDKVSELCSNYATRDHYDEVLLKTDIANLIGVCVVTGNVRRSAELGLCDFDDPEFFNIKNYNKHPYRQSWGWMSNNSVRLINDSDFENIDRIAQANIDGYDIGYVNMRNVPKGRICKHDDIRKDKATGINPCGEINLEDKEVCNVGESLPTRCVDHIQWLRACEFVTFYCSTVALLPTHQPVTNKVVNRNRRIGVSIIDFTGWLHQQGVSKVTSYLREGYKKIREVNKRLAEEAGVPESIRVTTMKPGGTCPKLAGKTAGAGYPTFKYTIRRIRIQANTVLERLMKEANIPNEPDAYSKNTTTFEYPIVQGPAPPATEISIWQQAMNVVLLQREWSDNAVSNTLYFKPRWSQVSKSCVDEGGFIKFYLTDNSTVHVPRSKLESRFTNYSFEMVIDKIRYRVIKRTPIESCTLQLYNTNHEEDQVEAVLAAIAPLTKSVSLLPHSDVGLFAQMPEEGITKEEYEQRLAGIKAIDWTKFIGSDGQDEKYCDGDKCVIIQ